MILGGPDARIGLFLNVTIIVGHFVSPRLGILTP